MSIDGKILRDALISGANNIYNYREEVDELNVFPVPDGDTGTNMGMTLAAAKEELALLPDTCTVAQAAKVAASAMLRGARGNSGVITSLLFRGFSKELEGKTTANVEDFLQALAKGVESAYKAVMKPTEGTMLTVARVASEKAAATQHTSVASLWQFVVQQAQIALDYTPQQLPILKKAGVVDAGGQGLLYIFEGMLRVINGGKPVETTETPKKAKKEKLSTANVGRGVFAQELNPDITNAYCTEFLVNKENGNDPVKLRAFMESNGDSVVMVDDDDIIKCHVHTANPGKILSAAQSFGYLSKIKIENMHEQYVQRKAQGIGLEKQASAEAEHSGEKYVYAAVDTKREFGFVAVAAGQGLFNVFTDLGVDAMVSGGQTMNPSTEDILAAVQSVPAKTVFVLPNNKNIIMAAEQAVKLADRNVVVLPTRTVPQGMGAMLSFSQSESVKTNTIEMSKAAENVSTGLITFAARDSDFDGKKIKRGEIIALEDGKLVNVGTDLAKTTYRLARAMCKKHTGFITVVSGCDVSDEEAEAVTQLIRAKVPPSIEVSHISGGQPVYYYMLAVE